MYPPLLFSTIKRKIKDLGCFVGLIVPNKKPKTKNKKPQTSHLIQNPVAIINPFNGSGVFVQYNLAF